MTELRGNICTKLTYVTFRHSDSQKTKKAWKQAEVFPSYTVPLFTWYLKYFSKRSICVHQLNNSTPCTFKASLVTVCLGNRAATELFSLKEKILQ